MGGDQHGATALAKGAHDVPDRAAGGRVVRHRQPLLLAAAHLASQCVRLLGQLHLRQQRHDLPPVEIDLV